MSRILLPRGRAKRVGVTPDRSRVKEFLFTPTTVSVIYLHLVRYRIPASAFPMNASQSAVEHALGGNYTILREIEGGGMSRLYHARQLDLGRDVVVKILPPDLVAELRVERFQREIHLAARLQHPHIVPILTAGSGNGLLFYTMPFIDGPTLAARLSDTANPITQLEAISIIRDVADALSYAHSEGVIHRDVKPQNIILKAGHALVVDFGVAKAVTAAADDSSLTSTGLALGTPLYISPEQAMAEPNVDGRTDIYSLGVVAFEVLTSKPPFHARSQQGLLAAHVTQKPPNLAEINPAVPAPLADVVMRCLEKDPDRRWQSADELRDRLNDLGARFTPAHNIPEVPTRALGSNTVSGSTGLLSRNARLVVAGLGLLGVTGVAWQISTRRIVDSAVPPAVAVLPFENVSGTSGSDYFADGMTRELASNLGKIEGLRVASTASAAVARQKIEDVRQIATRLNVTAVVEGTVRHIGNTVVVDAQLTNGKTGYQLWSSEFTDQSSNLTTLQARMVKAIGTALVGRLVPRNGHSLAEDTKVDPRVLEYFYQGQYLENDFDREKLELAVSRYKLALGIDPTFARAYAGIAHAMYHLADDYLPPKDAYPQLRIAALKAIELDSTLADAHASLGAYELSYGWNWSAAKEHLDKALALDPQSSFAHLMLGWYDVITGKPEDAVQEGLNAASLDPFSDEIGGNVISLMRSAGRHDLAINQTHRMLADGVGEDAQLYARLARESIALGKLNTAQLELDSALAADSTCCRRTRAFLYAAKGDRNHANEIITGLAGGRANGYYRADFIAEAAAAAGDTADAFKWLDVALSDRSSSFPLFPFSTELAVLSKDSRFRILQEKLRLPNRNNSVSNRR